MTLTVGSAFSGIGGIDLGLQRAGMEIRWQIEIDDWCQRVLAKHWPDVTRYGDIRELTGDELEPVDVIAGGFPCQPVSTAGRRKGADDERWMWPEFARLIRIVRPRWVLVENVTGLRSIDDGRLFGTVLRDLAACGYDAEWDCIPASAVGAPHQRDRVWIVAHSRCTRQSTGGVRGRAAATREVFDVGVADGCTCADVDNAMRQRCDEHVCEVAAKPNRYGTEDRLFSPSSADGTWRSFGAGDWWAVEPAVGRVADGIPGRVDRIRGLGNAVVPQVVELIGRRIVEAV